MRTDRSKVFIFSFIYLFLSLVELLIEMRFKAHIMTHFVEDTSAGFFSRPDKLNIYSFHFVNNALILLINCTSVTGG